jgi:hypothetical protein
MTAAIVEFPKTNSDVLKQLLATAMKLEASDESEACISIQREIICTLLTRQPEESAYGHGAQ